MENLNIILGAPCWIITRDNPYDSGATVLRIVGNYDDALELAKIASVGNPGSTIELTETILNYNQSTVQVGRLR